MDADEFHPLACAELDSVFRFAMHLCRDRQEAEDVVQETYLRALRACDQFKSDAGNGVRPWLFKILHNLVNSRLSKTRRDRQWLDEYRNRRTAAEPVGITDSIDQIDWDSVDQRVKAAVSELPIDQRAVFLLAAVEGLRYREIADVVGIPIGTVMSRLSRARQSLAAKLTDVASENNLRPGRVSEDDGKESIAAS